MVSNDPFEPPKFYESAGVQEFGKTHQAYGKEGREGGRERGRIDDL